MGVREFIVGHVVSPYIIHIWIIYFSVSNSKEILSFETLILSPLLFYKTILIRQKCSSENHSLFPASFQKVK